MYYSFLNFQYSFYYFIFCLKKIFFFFSFKCGDVVSIFYNFTQGMHLFLARNSHFFFFLSLFFFKIVLPIANTIILLNLCYQKKQVPDLTNQFRLLEEIIAVKENSFFFFFNQNLFKVTIIIFGEYLKWKLILPKVCLFFPLHSKNSLLEYSLAVFSTIAPVKNSESYYPKIKISCDDAKVPWTLVNKKKSVFKKSSCSLYGIMKNQKEVVHIVCAKR